MIVRSLLVALAGLVLCAAEAPPPAVLEPYVKDGKFEPGDYGWMKGRFDDATADEKAAYSEIVRWHSACWMAARDERRATLAAEGYPEAETAQLSPPQGRCLDFGQPNVPDVRSYAEFQRELAAVRPVADTYLAAVGLAEEASRAWPNADLARRLQTRTVAEQMLRRAVAWSRGTQPNSPNLSPIGQAIFMSRIVPAMSAQDQANTEWLKDLIATSGWPRSSEVGPEAAMNAWLIAQHADHDPVFQREVLRLIEPLAATGEVRQQDFAYLYDRVMLKWAGKQRYGSQTQCRDGRYQPQPLEDEPAVDRLRETVGLPPIADYMAQMNARYGAC